MRLFVGLRFNVDKEGLLLISACLFYGVVNSFRLERNRKNTASLYTRTIAVV